MVALRKNDLVGLLFSGLFLLAVISIAWLALERIEAQTKANSREALQTVLETTQEALQIWAGQRSHNVLELASLPQLREMVTALLAEPRTARALIASLHLERLREFMRPRLNEYSDKGFFIIAPDRINVGSMRDENLAIPNLIHQQRPEYLERMFLGRVSFRSHSHFRCAADGPARAAGRGSADHLRWFSGA